MKLDPVLLNMALSWSIKAYREKNKDSIKILQHIRDETHRFGVAYNRSLRKFD